MTVCTRFLLCHHSSSAEIFLDEEDWIFSSPQEEKVIEESIVILKKKSHNDIGHNYKLGEKEKENGLLIPTDAHSTNAYIPVKSNLCCKYHILV